MKELTPEVVNAGASFLGSFTALLFLKEGGLRSAAFFVAGGGMACLLGPHLAKFTGLPPTFAGWLLGAFGMAIVTKVFMAIDNVQASSLNEWIRKLAKLD